MNRDEMAGSLGKLRQELHDGAKSISQMLIPAAERTIAECRYALLRLHAKLRDPASELTELEDGTELQKALELARAYLAPEINALAKLRHTVREAFEGARAALLAADEELDSIGVCLQPEPLEQ
jgi:hypothetical protein